MLPLKVNCYRYEETNSPTENSRIKDRVRDKQIQIDREGGQSESEKDREEIQGELQKNMRLEESSRSERKIVLKTDN